LVGSDFEGTPKRDVDIGGKDDVLSYACAGPDAAGWTSASFTRKV
jgi:hypothetical protein